MANQKTFEVDLQKEKNRQRVTRVVVQLLLYAFLIFIAFIIVFPFYFMLISSVKTLDEYKLPVQTLWPNKIVFHNYI